MAARPVRPRAPRHPRLLIWGELEARLQAADLLLLGGLNEGVWPRAAEPGPWLNRKMRDELGLAPVERRIGLAAHDFVQAASAKRGRAVARREGRAWRADRRLALARPPADAARLARGRRGAASDRCLARAGAAARCAGRAAGPGAAAAAAAAARHPAAPPLGQRRRHLDERSLRALRQAHPRPQAARGARRRPRRARARHHRAPRARALRQTASARAAGGCRAAAAAPRPRGLCPVRSPAARHGGVVAALSPGRALGRGRGGGAPPGARRGHRRGRGRARDRGTGRPVHAGRARRPARAPPRRAHHGDRLQDRAAAEQPRRAGRQAAAAAARGGDGRGRRVRGAGWCRRGRGAAVLAAQGRRGGRRAEGRRRQAGAGRARRRGARRARAPGRALRPAGDRLSGASRGRGSGRGATTIISRGAANGWRDGASRRGRRRPPSSGAPPTLPARPGSRRPPAPARRGCSRIACCACCSPAPTRARSSA